MMTSTVTSGTRKTSPGSRNNVHGSPLRPMPKPTQLSTKVLACSSPSFDPTQRRWPASQYISTTNSTRVHSHSHGPIPSRNRLVPGNHGKRGRLTSHHCAVTHPSPLDGPNSSSPLTG